MGCNDSKPLPELSENDIARFLEKVCKRDLDDCWPWTGGCFSDGYGTFWAQGRSLLAHRVAVLVDTRKDPFPLLVCHSCDVRYPIRDKKGHGCCNPNHLFIGMPRDNTADMVSKRRQATGERSGAHTKPERVPRGARSGRRLHPENYLGERNSSAKLTAEKVRLMRLLYATGVTRRTLEATFHVSYCTVSEIVHEKTWRHLL